MNLRLLSLSLAALLVACTKTASPPSKAPDEARVAVIAAKPIETLPAPEYDWTGNYNAHWSAGPPPPDATSGVTVYRGYQILVKRARTGLVAYVSADGWQTMMRLVGEATPSADNRELAVRFAECGAEDMFQCNTFHKGDLLFSIVRKDEAIVLALSTSMTPDLARHDLPLTKD